MKRFMLLVLMALFLMGCGGSSGDADSIEEVSDTNVSGCVSAAVRDVEDVELSSVEEYVFPATTLEEAYVVRPTDYYKGAPDPEIILFEYGDFQCPACGAFSPVGSGAIKEFNEDFGIIYRHFPLTHIHPHAHKAAQGAEAAGAQGKFWAFHDAVYGCQQKLAKLGERDAQKLFVDIASDLGLDADRFEQELDDEIYAEYIDQSIAEAVSIGVEATPSGLIHPFGAEVMMLKGLPVAPTWWTNTLTRELANRGIEK